MTDDPETWDESPQDGERSDDGGEPDARFTFANERTFLAWLRTSLALMAAGVGVAAFATEVLDPWVRQASAVALIALGTLASAVAYPRWRRNQAALRQREPLPLSRLGPVLGYALSGLAVVIAVALLVTGA